jgi:hypothetical protein
LVAAKASMNKTLSWQHVAVGHFGELGQRQRHIEFPLLTEA